MPPDSSNSMTPSRQALDISQRLIPFHQAFTLPTSKAYCVYTHSHKGVVFYVGKGVASRPFQPGRNAHWAAYVQQLGTYEVSIVFWTDQEKRAYAEERRLIQMLQPACNVRAGRPRPRLGTAPLVKLTIMVEPQTVAGIDRLMAKMQATLRSVRVDRSTAAREALTLGLEQAGCVEGQETPAPSPVAQATAAPQALPRPRRARNAVA